MKGALEAGSVEDPVGEILAGLGAGFERWIWSERALGEVVLAAAEGEVGASFPEEYRRFVLTHGCAAVIRQADGEGLEIYGLARSCPSPMDVRRRRDGFVVGDRTDLVPVVGEAGGAPVLAFDPAGGWYRVRGGDMDAIDGGFVDEVRRLVAALRGPGEGVVPPALGG